MPQPGRSSCTPRNVHAAERNGVPDRIRTCESKYIVRLEEQPRFLSDWRAPLTYEFPTAGQDGPVWEYRDLSLVHRRHVRSSIGHRFSYSFLVSVFSSPLSLFVALSRLFLPRLATGFSPAHPSLSSPINVTVYTVLCSTLFFKEFVLALLPYTVSSSFKAVSIFLSLFAVSRSLLFKQLVRHCTYGGPSTRDTLKGLQASPLHATFPQTSLSRGACTHC